MGIFVTGKAVTKSAASVTLLVTVHSRERAAHSQECANF